MSFGIRPNRPYLPDWALWPWLFLMVLLAGGLIFALLQLVLCACHSHWCIP
jgi:hypothetical protein